MKNNNFLTHSQAATCQLVEFLRIHVLFIHLLSQEVMICFHEADLSSTKVEEYKLKRKKVKRNKERSSIGFRGSFCVVLFGFDGK